MTSRLISPSVPVGQSVPASPAAGASPAPLMCQSDLRSQTDRSSAVSEILSVAIPRLWSAIPLCCRTAPRTNQSTHKKGDRTVLPQSGRESTDLRPSKEELCGNYWPG
jgi:hypothetical protein